MSPASTHKTRYWLCPHRVGVNEYKRMLQYRKHMVGYLDLLGARHYMKSDRDGEYLNTVYHCFEIAEKIADAMYKTVDEPFNTKIFSDNIIVALPCTEINSSSNNNPIIALNRITAIMGALQRNLLEHNILSRGSITYGDLFIDNLMVFGNALIQAYELENGVAVFPRVVFSKQAQEFDLKLELEGNVVSTNQLYKDHDGLFFLDYLNFPHDENIQTLVTESMDWVVNQIAAESDFRILQKLGWHKKYLESFFERKESCV